MLDALVSTPAAAAHAATAEAARPLLVVVAASGTEANALPVLLPAATATATTSNTFVTCMLPHGGRSCLDR